MNNQETVIDIIREMRIGSTSGLPCAYRIGRPNRIGEPIQIDSVTVADLADRIEAAAEREREAASLRAIHAVETAIRDAAPGNAAAMRFALADIEFGSNYCIERCVTNSETDDVLRFVLGKILDIVKPALAAPPRNCDLIENELNIDPERVPEALNKCENAPIRELIRWIFAKAEPKGGAK